MITSSNSPRGDLVVRTIDRRATQRALTAAGIGGILTAGLFGLSLNSATSPAAAASGSTAYGVIATGIDKKSANSGSVSGSSFSASGISTETHPGYARATVGSLTVGGHAIGSITVTCEQGVTTVSHSGTAAETPFFHPVYGKGGGPSAVGVTVTITGAQGKVNQTVSAAGVSCDKAATPPPTSGPPTGSPTTPPTGNPTGRPTSKPGPAPTKTTKPGKTTAGRAPDSDAKPVTPKPGHHAVTG